MSGYVRIHRTLIGHPAFRNDAEAMAFAWLVAKAAWRSVRVRYKDRGICLERGQLAISVREFASAMDRDKAWIERLLKRLKNEEMVETFTETGVTVVTICNYDQYQSEPVACETPDETPRKTQARQAQDTEQGSQKGKKEKIALPDWLPVEEWTAYRKMRRAMKVPFTEEAERGIIADLDKLRGEGHCPKKVLLKAVKRSWRGVFGDEDTKATTPAKPLTDEAIRNMERSYVEKGRQDYADEMRKRYPQAFGQITSGIMKRASAS